ncbi:MAG: serine acetyltransferase [Sphingobium sp.]|nr:serine acetyltransferase [Sphingobium sp.]
MTEIPAKRLADGISAEVPDWSREKKVLRWDPSKSLIASIRSYQRHEGRSGLLAMLGRRYANYRHRFWTIVTGANIPITTRIGGGLVMPHPGGIVVHADAEIGPNCLIMQNVTVGTNVKGGVPRIGGHVDLFAGACVLGAVTIGDHARIGALALVLEDVPPGATVVAPRAQIRTDNQMGKA